MSILKPIACLMIVGGCGAGNLPFGDAAENKSKPRDAIPTPIQAAAEAGAAAYADSLEPHCKGFKDEYVRLQCFKDVAEGRGIAAAASAAALAQTNGHCDLSLNADGSYDVINMEIDEAGVAVGVDCSLVMTPEDVIEILGQSAKAAGWTVPKL